MSVRANAIWMLVWILNGAINALSWPNPINAFCCGLSFALFMECFFNLMRKAEA